MVSSDGWLSMIPDTSHVREVDGPLLPDGSGSYFCDGKS
jgi:hypothetical protein